jgi:hypothetical protein
MPDQSHLDSRYFIDRYKYNCPFCNRRHVAYHVESTRQFDWTDTKKCFVYFVDCDSCGKRSMHLTFAPLDLSRYQGGDTRFAKIDGVEDMGAKLDETFFYSVPTSFFVLDERVPRKLRELLTEAEGCAKTNFLTGASACARKIVYELAVLSNATGENYDDRIKSLKTIHKEVDPAFFDTLLTIRKRHLGAALTRRPRTGLATS